MSGMIIGLGVSAVGIGMSAHQAGKQNKLRKAAQEEAAVSMQKAEELLKTNYMEGLSTNKLIYEQQQLANKGQGAQALQAISEGDQRGVGAGVGRVQMATQSGEASIAAQQEKELNALKFGAAKEDVRLQNAKYNLQMMGVQGAQQAAADADAAQQAALGQVAAQSMQLGMGIIGNENINKLYKTRGTTTLGTGANIRNKTLKNINNAGGNAYMNSQITPPIQSFDSVSSPSLFNNDFSPEVFDPNLMGMMGNSEIVTA